MTRKQVYALANQLWRLRPRGLDVNAADLTVEQFAELTNKHMPEYDKYRLAIETIRDEVIPPKWHHEFMDLARADRRA